jgi:fatty-acid desaturase
MLICSGSSISTYRLARFARLGSEEAHHNDTARMARYAPDLGRDRFYRWLSTYHWVPLALLGLVLLAIGGWGLVNWAIFLRVVVGLHSTG